MKKDVLNYRMTDDNGIGVYCGTYGKYNGGSIYGMWIDLTAVDDADEFFDVCRTLHDDESDPEFMFQDFQGFPEDLYSECMGVDVINKIIEYAHMADGDREMLEDFAECYGGDISEYDLEDIQDRCCGQFEDWDDFADHNADEMIDAFEAQCKHDYSCKGAAGMIDILRRYFDYDAYNRELKYSYSIGSNGYVFYL